MSPIIYYAILAGIIGVIFNYFEDSIFSFMEKNLGVKLKRKYCKSVDCYTYSGLSILLIFIGLILYIPLYIPISIDYNNFLAFVGLFFMFIYPVIVMLIRKNTFNEKTITYKGLGHVPRNMLEECTGYCPAWYWLFSLMIAGSSTVWGFSMLNFPSTPQYIGIIIIITGLFSQTFILFPDVIDRIVPVDMKTYQGLKLMLIISITLTIILMFIRLFLII